MTFKQVDRKEQIEIYSRLWNLEYPESPRSAEEVGVMVHHLSPGAFEEAWVLVEEGEPIGLVPVLDFDGKSPTERVEADLLMHPDFEHRYGEAITQFETVAASSGAAKWCIWTHDRNPARLNSLLANSYEVKQTVPCSMLDVAGFDGAPFQQVVDNVKSSIRLASIKELADEGIDWIPPLYEMNWELAQDVPSPHPISPMPMDQFIAMVTNPRTHPPETMFVALDGGKMVGYSRVTPSLAREDLAFTGLSGVVRSHRRRGIVTALKVHGIEAMRELGIRWLQTDNDETNPMYQLNLQLGFKPVWKWLQFVKEVA